MLAVAAAPDSVYVGLDFGTSGARLCAIDGDEELVATAQAEYHSVEVVGWATAWQTALFELLDAVPADIKAHTARLAFDGTSATSLLVDRTSGHVIADARLYNEAQPAAAVTAATKLVGSSSAAAAGTSALSKLLSWHDEGAWQTAAKAGMVPGLLHQADWLASLLTGERRVTDWNNALKLGFDVHTLTYPTPLLDHATAPLLPPSVLEPGADVALVSPSVSRSTGLAASCVVAAGTTDSIAAFLAAGASEVGDAVTSLGSTLAVKLLSERPVEDGAAGVYSHRLGVGWLVGGASNTGGAVLRQHFSDAELERLTERMDAATPTGLGYYPLPRRGERFPVMDPYKEPLLSPRPASDAVFLQGMLEGIAEIERLAYAAAAELGATPVRRVLTAGGGAKNSVWTDIRQQALGVPVSPAKNGEASFGAALLAKAHARS